MSDVQASPLGEMPEALKSKNRSRTVTLADGSTVTVEKWSWLKFQDCFLLVGDPAKARELAIKSVSEADRARVEAMDPEDLMAIAAAAGELNVTPGLLKNAQSLLRMRRACTEAASSNELESKSPGQ
jgi:hypothetical protein